VPTARIKDVAQAAGVSTATVSRVLSGDAKVSEELARRVWTAAEQLDYHPNRVARRLRRPGREMWALIVPDIENQFFTSVARGVEDVANGLGITVFLGNTDSDADRLRRYLDTALSEQVAGIILGPGSPHDDVRSVVASGTPLVIVDQPLVGPSVTTVMSDNHQGGVLAGSVLRGRGYDRIAVIAGPVADPSWNARLQGVEEEFARDGRSITLVERGDNRLDGGREAMARVLDAQTGAQAVFITNNLMTIGALRELDARGIVAPEQFGVIGYDLNSASLSRIAPVPTVNQDPRRIGAVAAQHLVTLRDGAAEVGSVILLPPVLVEDAGMSVGA
jgi:LacI family transcriptional regulator